VIIGGQSRRSRIFSVDTRTAAVAGHLLDPEEGSRTKVLEYLAEMGFDVGSAGVSHRRATDGSGGVRTRGIEERLQDDDVPSATTSETDAARLQHRAEREGIDTLTHQERWRVACRLLKTYGWDYSWEWFNQRFGSEFKPEVTWTQFRSVIKSYPTDYSHVEVPPRP
jgi:hypothetical protein